MSDEQRPSEQPGAGQWAEDALRESEARFRNLLQNVQSVSVQGYGPDGTTQYWNQASEQLYGYSAEEAIGRNLVDLIIPPEMRGNVEQAMRQMAETGQPIPASELSLMRKDGSRVSVFSSHAIIHVPGKAQELFCVDIDITDRKQAEKQLAQSHDLLGNLARLVPGVVYQYRLYPDGRSAFPYSSPGMNDIYEVTPEEVREDATPVFGRLHPDDYDRVSDSISESARTLQEFYCEFRVILPRQGLRWRWSQAHPERMADGGALWHGIISDITERKQAEEALREREAQNLALINAFPDILFTNHRDGEFLAVHTSHPELLFAPPETFLHRKVEEIMPKPLSDQIMKAFTNALDLEAMQELNYVLPVGGEERHYEARVTPCTKDTVITVVRDITERKRAEEAVRESEARYRLLAENMTDVVWLMDMNLQLTYASPSSEKLRGYTLEEVRQMPLTKHLTPPSLQVASAALLEEMTKVTANLAYIPRRTLQLEFYRKDGSTYWSESTFSLIQDENGSPVSILCEGRDITDRKQAEEALRESEEKYRALVENANEAIIVTQEGVLKFANPRVSKLLGYSIEQVVGRPFIELIHPDDRNLVAERYRKRLEGELPAVVYPFRTLHQDGSIRWAEINSVRIAWEGKPAIMSYLSDITERKQAEEELRESEERYRLINDASLDFVYSYDKTDRFTSANRSLCAALGLRTEQILGKTHAELGFPVAQSQDWDDLHRRVYETGTTVTAFTSTPMPDGIIRQYEVVLNPLHDHAGAITGIAGTTRDITERKRAEEALRESEDRYRTLLENVGEGIGFVNPEEQFGYTNAASEDIFGVPPSGLLGRSLHEFANSEQFGLIREQTKRHRAGEKSVYEIEISRPSGENRDLLVTAVPQFDSQGKFVGALGVFRDITDRKRLEQEMAKARADFLFAVSHELKTPLFLMASAQELLESLPEEQRAGRFLEYGEIWNRNLHRLRHLIENLVDSQRTEGMGLKITLVPTNISETLQQTLKDVELLARRQRISFRLHLDPLPEIPADPESIHRLFENLLTNAIKFSPADGEVQVSLTLQGEEVLFRVSDFGLGIAASEISQLFQPFQRTSGANQAVIPGTGLGLYTAKLIAEAHSGSIALESEEGQGTTVVVRLPLHPGIIGT